MKTHCFLALLKKRIIPNRPSELLQKVFSHPWRNFIALPKNGKPIGELTWLGFREFSKILNKIKKINPDGLEELKNYRAYLNSKMD